MKFYFCRFEHKKTQKAFYKFGITSKTDVLERFNCKYDQRYSEFNIKVMYSAYGSREEVEKAESTFLAAFPKNFYLETYLGESRGYYNGLSGITETCVLTSEDVKRILEILHNIKTTDNKLNFI